MTKFQENPSLGSRLAGVLVLALLLGLTTIASPAAAQDLTLFYVAPTADMTTHFDVADIVGVSTSGYRAVEITATNQATFRAEAPADLVTLFDHLQTGQTLRNRVDAVRAIAGSKVDVELYLVDDRTGLSSGSGRFATEADSGNVYVWPAASTSKVSGTDDWLGRIGIGQWSADHIEANYPGGWAAVEATVLHEISHTQMIETSQFGSFSKWGVLNGRLITYGADGSHWIEEILGDQAPATEEGLGNFFGHLHNPADHQATIDFFRQTDERYFLEKQSVMAGVADLYNATRTEVELTDGTKPWAYTWKNIPGWYLLFSESTSTAYHFFFWQNAHDDNDKALEWIMSSSKAMHETRLKRFLTYTANRLSLEMETHAATAEGKAQKAAGTLVSSMFPFALLDVLTDFDMSEADYKADYGRNYPDADPKAFAEYWKHRADIEKAARKHLDAKPIEIEEAIEAVRTYLLDETRILQAN